MARRLRLRTLTRAERRLLREKLRDLSLSVRIHQRYRIIDAVRQGLGGGAVAERVGCHFTVVYDWVHRFNASGFGTFEQVPNPNGRPPILKAEQLPAWSVPKLAAYCRGRRLLPPVTDEWVRRLLRREGLSAQRVRTWKTSQDPAFDRKKTPSAASISAARRAPR